MNRSHVLHVTTELHPLSGSGGVGSVVGALARALRRLDTSVAVVVPRPPGVDPVRWGLARRLDPLAGIAGDGDEATVYEGALPEGGVQAFVIDHPALVGGDIATRSAAIARAAIAIANRYGPRPEVIHTHDATAIALALFASSSPEIATIASIHGSPSSEDALGLVTPEAAIAAGLPEQLWADVDTSDHGGRISLLEIGLHYADHIVADAPSHARLLCDDSALARCLGERRDRVHGIVNGIDDREWNPQFDPFLPARFGADNPSGKLECKRAAQRELGLPPRPREPLIVAVGKFSRDDGVSIVAALDDTVADWQAQLAFVGCGDGPLTEHLRSVANRFPTRIAIRTSDDVGLTHRAIAGADFAFVPRRFEPGRPSQLYSLRYGAIPILHGGGGFIDTIVDYEEFTNTGSAVVFHEHTGEAVRSALRRAAHAFADREGFALLVARAMRLDVSWTTSAARHRDLYTAAVKRRKVAG